MIISAALLPPFDLSIGLYAGGDSGCGPNERTLVSVCLRVKPGEVYVSVNGMQSNGPNGENEPKGGSDVVQSNKKEKHKTNSTLIEKTYVFQIKAKVEKMSWGQMQRMCKSSK